MYFPQAYRLSNRYRYAKNNKIFLPIAWIHRIIRCVFNKNYSLSDKVRMYFKSKHILKNHRTLIDWLEL